MFRNLLLIILVLTGVLIFAASCASNPAAPSPAAPSTEATAVPNTPTATSTVPTSPVAATAAQSPTAGSQSGDSSTSGIVKLQIVPEKSQARYRVREQLASLSLPSDAVGKTSAISGMLVGKTDGTIDSTLSKFVVDLSTLQSDRSQRDNFLRRNVLETDQYKDATFVPKQATGLPSSFPSTGQTTFKLTGDLTIRDVTKSVTWDVSCQGQDTEGLCHATTSFNFEYFSLTQPHVSIVLSIVDNITLELDADLKRLNN